MQRRTEWIVISVAMIALLWILAPHILDLRHKATTRRLEGVYFLLRLDGSSERMNAESLYIKKGGKFELHLPMSGAPDDYGTFVEGTWVASDDFAVRLTPQLVDGTSRRDIDKMLASAEIPAKFAPKIDLGFQSRTLTPDFKYSEDRPSLRVNSPGLEQLVFPELKGHTVYFVPMGKR